MQACGIIIIVADVTLISAYGWPELMVMVAFVLLLLTACLFPLDATAQYFAGTNLSLNSSTYYALLADVQTQTTGQYVFSVGYSRSLGSQEAVAVTLSGSLSRMFIASRSDQRYIVVTSGTLPPGRYSFDLIAVLTVTGGIPSLVTAAALVEVFSQTQSCVNQSFGICSQLCSVCNASSTCKYGYQCSCLEGYILQLDGYTCLANDPPPQVMLSTSSSISQLDPFLGAVRQLGVNASSFDCSYRQRAVFFVNNNSISMYDMDTGMVTVLLSNNGSPILDLVLDPVDGNVFFCTEKSIMKLYRSAGLVMEVVSVPSSRVITVYNRLVLWAEGYSAGLSDIKFWSMDSSNATTVVSGIVNMVDMAVDVVTGLLYWITGSIQVKVQKSNLNGSGVKDVYVSQVGTLVGVAVFEDFVYVVSSHGVVLKVDKFGRQGAFPLVYFTSPNPALGYGNIHIYHPLNEPPSVLGFNGCLVNNGGCSHFCIVTAHSYYCNCPSGYSLLVDGKTCTNTALCDSHQLGCEQGCSVVNGIGAQCTCNHGYQLQVNGACIDINECLSPGTCSHSCTNTEGSYLCSCPSGLFLTADQRSCSGCTLSNGGCGQLCMTSSDLTGYSCQCGRGYQLSSNGVSCIPNDVSQILFSATRRVSQEVRGTLLKARPDGYVLDTLVDSISVSNAIHTGLVYGMDFDLERQVLYYGDRNSSALWEVPLTRVAQGQDSRVKLLGGVHAWSLSYDWIHHDLYWTDDVQHIVGRASLLPLGVAQTVVSGLHTPCGLAVDPFQGYIYWTESGASPRICRLPMNSTSVEVLFLTDLVQPLGITLDLLRGLLFWADPGKQSIEYSTPSGRGRGIAVSSVGLRPFQIALHRNYLIWTSQGDTVFYVAEMLNASRIGKLSVVNSLSEMFPLYGIAVVNQNRRQSVDIDPCQPNPCPEGSVCTPLMGVVNFTCTCPPRTFNNTTTTQVDCTNRIQYCVLSSPCAGRDVCYNCSCVPGYSGEDCSLKVLDRCDSLSCLNGATCVVSHGGVATCLCAPGYGGSYCDAGGCADGDTGCPVGTYGAGCTNNCSCLNGGRCSPMSGFCTCPDGYGGQQCQTRVCPADYCLNGGTCTVTLDTTIQCRCPSSTSGNRCEFNDGPIINFQTKAAAIGAPSAAILGLLVVLVSGIAVFFCIRYRRKGQKHPIKDGQPAAESNIKSCKSCDQCKGLMSDNMLTPSLENITSPKHLMTIHMSDCTAVVEA